MARPAAHVCQPAGNGSVDLRTIQLVDEPQDDRNDPVRYAHLAPKHQVERLRDASEASGREKTDTGRKQKSPSVRGAIN